MCIALWCRYGLLLCAIATSIFIFYFLFVAEETYDYTYFDNQVRDYCDYN